MKYETIRSRAPMRISFGGGGSEIDPFMSAHGGKVMNSTISLYAHTLVERTNEKVVQVVNGDTLECHIIDKHDLLKENLNNVPKSCLLAIATIRFIIKEFKVEMPGGIKITTHSDAPIGSGLGASSTMTVAIAHGLLEFFGINSEPYFLARLAYRIEREFLGLSGGIQDHFCAAFGGFNFMEFGPGDHLLINPLRIKHNIRYELETSLILIYTGTSRESARIIDSQISSMSKKPKDTSQTLFSIAENAENMKTAILKGHIGEFGRLLSEGWKLKSSLSPDISNATIEKIQTVCEASGSLGLKLCGAGGGGFLLVAIKPEDRSSLIRELGLESDYIQRVNFVEYGSEVWSLENYF